jgi:hypothetical protein
MCGSVITRVYCNCVFFFFGSGCNGVRPVWLYCWKKIHALTISYNEGENVCCFCVVLAVAQACPLIFLTTWFPPCSLDKACDRSLSISVFLALHVTEAALVIC